MHQNSHKTQQESCEVQKLAYFDRLIHTHSYWSCSDSPFLVTGLCFIIMVRLTDENTLTSNRQHAATLSLSQWMKHTIQWSKLKWLQNPNETSFVSIGMMSVQWYLAFWRWPRPSYTVKTSGLLQPYFGHLSCMPVVCMTHYKTSKECFLFESKVEELVPHLGSSYRKPICSYLVTLLQPRHSSRSRCVGSMKHQLHQKCHKPSERRRN